jgi:hypothetical protein
VAEVPLWDLAAAAAVAVAAQYREQASVSAEQPGRLTAEMVVLAMAAAAAEVAAAHRFQCVSPAHVRVRRTHKAEPAAVVANHK